MLRPEKKRKLSTTKTKKRSLAESAESSPNPSLPYDLIVSILARVSRSYYPNLSLVSKSFHSILASPELYQTRTLLGCTETFLYVCLRFPDEANPRWFTLHRKPNQTLINHTTKKKKNKKKLKKKKDTSGVNLLAPISFLNSPPMEWSAIISVGHNLYAISANIEKAPYSTVPFLDCRTNTWLEAPRMRLAHTEIFEGRMYLPGTSEKPDSLNCVEVYNTKTQTWKPVPPERRIFQLLNFEGKIYKNFDLVSARKGLTFHFTPTHLECGLVGLNTDSYGRSRCMIGNKSYRYKNGYFTWKEFDGSDKKVVSRKLEGLERLPKFASYCTVKLVNYGGKLVVLWDKYVHASRYKEKMIWCAEISLKKRNSKEIWGNVEWFGAVLKVPRSYKILCATDATL